MIQFSEEIRRAVDISVKMRLPFAVYVRPASGDLCFFADPGEESPLLSDRAFIVNAWCGGAGDEFVIRDRASAASVVELIGSNAVSQCPAAWTESTDRVTYGKSLDLTIEHLQDHGGKVVVSRTIAGDAAGVDWIKVAEEYFNCHDEAFRYFYYTPKHGFWIGASPEILLVSDGEHFETMALAGTRDLADRDLPWSGKNIAEQAIVRNYIVDRLYDLGLAPEVGPTETITTGNIQHLCTVIKGRNEDCRPIEILRALNPTPALAGYPLSAALEKIVEVERHPRRCYGGYVAISEACSLAAYVNLRCVNFDNAVWCMYVGGGIMPDSDIDDEWRETEAKSLILKDLIGNSRK